MEGAIAEQINPTVTANVVSEKISMPNLQCVYTTHREMKVASHKLRADNKEGIVLFKSISRHTINNPLLEPTLPLSDCLHGSFCMFPPEMLHTSDSGLIMYMLESLQIQVGEGMSRNELDIQHIWMSNTIRQQSERDFPRGTTRRGIIDSTRCQSSERKGYLFLLMCIAHTGDGELILQNQLGLFGRQWRDWLQFLKNYLTMEEWFHSSNKKDDVARARPTIGKVIHSLQQFFPRQEKSNGYNIPKLHGFTKMQYYMCLFGSAMNFYGGPGEASHKQFVKAPGLKTQRQIFKFAKQTAGQYYNIIMLNHAIRHIDMLANNLSLDEDDGNTFERDIFVN